MGDELSKSDLAEIRHRINKGQSNNVDAKRLLDYSVFLKEQMKQKERAAFDAGHNGWGQGDWEWEYDTWEDYESGNSWTKRNKGL